MTRESRPAPRRPRGWAEVKLAPGAVERILEKVRIGEFDCWHWTGSKKLVYGELYHNPMEYVWRVYKGVPPRIVVRTCDGADCVNPQHLEGADGLCHSRRHPLNPSNVLLASNGRRQCIACREERFSVCRNGHDLEETGMERKDGWRTCGVCARERAAARYAEKRDAINAARRQKRAAMSAEERREHKRREYWTRRNRMSLAERAEEARTHAGWRARRRERLAAEAASQERRETA